MKIHTRSLKTPFETQSKDKWKQYPRPQMKRESYLSLCGDWEISFLENETETPLGTICVPFPPESRLSGIERPSNPSVYVYTKRFSLPDGFIKNKVLLHFGAVDQTALVFLNGCLVGEHIGGYLPFTFEIQEYMRVGENVLRVEVTDRLDVELAYGKQRFKRGGMWYTPISGIWQPVWLESVPANYIRSIKFVPTLDSITVQTLGGNFQKSLTIHTEAGDQEYRYEGDSVTVHIDSPKLWSPESPHLYPITLSDGEDEFESYFALRTVSIRDIDGVSYICLNEKPYFFHGLLDQGYFSDGIYLPATPDGYLWDIKTAKSLGFNMLRKHIKIEPEIFYYYCDKYGMIVFQDMVNSGKYHYITDTVLPTIGFRRRFDYPVSARRQKHFKHDSLRTVELLYNHPSVCYYTIFNEGWGQHHSDSIYKMLKTYDPTRIWDAVSGWFAKKESDVISEHIYFRKIKCKSQHNRPLVLSEFGGYSCKIADHAFNPYKNYGYKTYHDKQSFENGLLDLYREEIIPAIRQGLCATVLTQLSDVEDETNGLVTYDRMVVKTDVAVMKSLADELSHTFRKQVGRDD